MHSIARMRRIAASGLGALSAVFTLTGCGGSKTGTAATSRTNTLVVSLAAVSGNVDPAQFDGNIQASINEFIESPVFGYRPFGSGARRLPSATEVTPALGSKYSVTSKGLIVMLRKGVKSQYGNPLTAEDVKWSFDRMAALHSTFFQEFAAVGGINTKSPVTIMGPTEVRLNGKPTPLTPAVLTSTTGMNVFDAVAAKKHATPSDPWAKTWLATHSATFGPYEVASFQPNSQLTLDANPYYYGGKVAYKKVSVIATSQAGQSVELVQSGQAQIAQGVPYSSAAALGGGSAAKVVTTPAEDVELLQLNWSFKPFSSPKVREAMNLAIDWPQLLAGPYKGFAVAAPWVVPTILAGVPVGAAPIYDLNKAKRLLAAAGYPKGFAFTLTVNPGELFSGPGAEPLTVFLKSELARAGINVTVQQVASNSQYDAGLAAKKYEASVYDLGPIVPDALYMLTAFTAGNVQNDYNVSDPQLDSLITAGLAKPVGQTRTMYLQNATRRVRSLEVNVPLAQEKVVYLFNRAVCGFKTMKGYIDLQYLRPCNVTK